MSSGDVTTRRNFIKQSLLLSGAAGMATSMPTSILRALAINPEPGSTFLDARHVVILMQENRSFDHCFGSLQGVRGFNDPRAFRLANGNPVWHQTNAEGKTYAPFRLDIKDTKATWMGSLPHSRASQTDAYNHGKHDQWLNACAHSNKRYAAMPLTMGYHNREDLPFNYALADAFTVCDQNFCSALTSTWPNRHYLWSGTIRDEQHPGSRARIRNDLDFGEAKWRTFPELLEANNIPWRVYQNDLTCGGGLEGEERSWLTNYTCNPLEYFSAYHVKFSDRYVSGLRQQLDTLPGEIRELADTLRLTDAGTDRYRKLAIDLTKKQEVLENAKTALSQWNEARFQQLSARERNLYEKAFSTNREDPHFRDITELAFHGGGEERKMTVPKGDVFHRFRKDVEQGELPMVSWLVSPQRFSDHPSAPWYGAWYVSEVLDILTRNPEVWKHTIFILTYDENDGYFDHVPPFVPPHPTKPHAGKCSAGIDTAIEWIPLAQELGFGISKKAARGGPIGLGYRVPMIIASPWSRGGRVNSQVFDHTSSLRFLEVFLSNKLGKPIKEDNISAWRRTVCGDLTSAFHAYQPGQNEHMAFLKRNEFLQTIYQAQFKQEPDDFRPLTEEEISRSRAIGRDFSAMPTQEKGVRVSCALPYQLYADGNLSADGKSFEISLSARKDVFGGDTAGSPFSIYAPVRYLDGDPEGDDGKMRNWQYAVSAGDSLTDTWPISAFADRGYHLRVYGPNGFFREYRGSVQDPKLVIESAYETIGGRPNQLTGNLVLAVKNLANKSQRLEIKDYILTKRVPQVVDIKGGETKRITIALEQSHGWYDVGVHAAGHPEFEKRYAGHVETGKDSVTDPVMGRMI